MWANEDDGGVRYIKEIASGRLAENRRDETRRHPKRIWGGHTNDHEMQHEMQISYRNQRPVYNWAAYYRSMNERGATELDLGGE